MRTIRVIIGLFIALCLILPASSQVRFGIVGGLNLANVSIDPDEGLDFKNRTALGVGGVLDFGLGNIVFIHFEPMFLQKGTKVEEGGSKLEIDADYIEVPLLLKFAFGTSGTKPYIMVGPTLGILMSAKWKVTAEGISAEVDVKDTTKGIDFGVSFGAGVSMPLGQNSLFVEARYALGLTNFNDDPEDPDTDIKTKGIQVFAGMTFPLGTK